MPTLATILENHPVKKGIITRREYNWLLENSTTLLPHELAKVKEFEDSLLASQIVSQPKCEAKPKVVIKGLPIDKTTVYKAFMKVFNELEKKPFELTDDTKNNLEPIIKYFAKDLSFANCKNLVKTFDGKQLQPDFNKGLLIIGAYGNGKTTIMSCLETAFKRMSMQAKEEFWDNARDWDSLRFKGAKVHDVVTQFETIKDGDGKDSFYKTYSGFRFYFDDVKKEKVASNFGKTEIMREILEKRYDRKAKTFITCNYKDNYGGDLEKAVFEYGERYGGHVYDRLFEMFNIIEFKGKSFRK